jgi:hypothetical protein
MRLLLDACVPRKLASEIPGHEVQSAVDLNLGNLDDGPLLRSIPGRFDVLVTVDANLPNQQSVRDLPLAVVVLRARTNRLADLRPLVPSLLAILSRLAPGEVAEVRSAPD